MQGHSLSKSQNVQKYSLLSSFCAEKTRVTKAQNISTVLVSGIIAIPTRCPVQGLGFPKAGKSNLAMTMIPARL